LGTEVRSAERLQAPLAITLGVMLLVVALLIALGLFVRATVSKAFVDAERIRLARTHVAMMFAQQLDEETGVRGYAVLRLPLMLEPYYGGRANMPLYLRRVRGDLTELDIPKALPALRDAARTNYRWVHEVAFQIVRSHRRHPALELRGKVYVDRFRADADAIDLALAARTVAVNTRAQEAVLWVGSFAVAAVVVVILAALLFTVQQYRLGIRLERERIASEEQRRHAAEARAAYETEKRIADILQDAFAERLLPSLPAVSFSATYLPAIEQAKVGGDWYDALQLSEDRVLVAIGDVTGHGIDAVVAMNKARQLLIGYALVDATPAGVLERVNFDLVRSKSPLITAICGIIDTRTREFLYACAGHPPPVLVEPRSHAKLLDFGSLPLGVAVEAGYRTSRVQVAAGAMLVLYTDGLIEYSRDLAQGEAALLEAAQAAAEAPAPDPAAQIRDTIFRERKVADDVAILTVRFSENSAGANLSRRIA
jgi:serine phosphatase RsbU (regulator of sigma subunit)/CHASE3 domain sensor protein